MHTDQAILHAEKGSRRFASLPTPLTRVLEKLIILQNINVAWDFED
jgi:hypothetical protein